MRLRSRITLTIVAVSLLPLALIGTIAYVVVSEMVGSLAIGGTSRMVKAAGHDISMFLDARCGDMRIYSNSPAVESMDWSRAGPFLAEELARHAGTYEKFVLANRDGTFYATNSPGNPAQGHLQTLDNADPASEPLRVLAREYFRQVVNDNSPDKVYISEPIISSTNGTRQIVLSTAVRHQGVVVGVLVGTLECGQLDETVASLRESLFVDLHPSCRMALLSREGSYVTHWDPQRLVQPVLGPDGEIVRDSDGIVQSTSGRLGQEQPEALSSLVSRVAPGASDSVRYADGADSTPMMAFIAPVPISGGALLMSLPADAVTGAIDHIRWLLLTAMGLILLVAVGSSLMLVRSVIGPVRQLNRASRQMAKGDFTAPLPPAEQDEIGELTQSFAHMAQSLQLRQHQLAERNELLVSANQRLEDEASQRLQTEQLLRAQRDFAENLVQTAHAMVCVMDCQGRIMRLNQFACERLGLQESQFLNRPLWDVVVTPPRSLMMREVFRKVVSGSGLTSGESTLTRADGKDIIVRWYCSLLHGDGGDVTGVLAIAHDISEIRQRDEQLRQMQKLEAVGQLAGGIAHDFNNILTVVLGNAELLRLNFEPHTEARQTIDQIISAARRAADLTRKLLTYSRKGHYRHTEVDMHEVARDAAEMLKYTLGEQIELRLSLNASRSAIHGDPEHLEHALLNLAFNARDAIESEGVIEIATSDMQLDTPLTARGYDVPAGRYLRLAVRDNGQGIPPELHGRIFEPFFTTKEVGKGTGLGLASVYGCVKNHNGFIEVQSEPPRGTVFTILLPALSDGTPTDNCPPFDAAYPASVALVQADPLLRRRNCRALTAAGYAVAAIPSLMDAERFCRQKRSQLKLAIIDCAWPWQWVVQAAINMRSHCPDLTIIALCSVEQASVAPALHAQIDACDVLIKPCQSDELLTCLARHLQPDRPSARQAATDKHL